MTTPSFIPSIILCYTCYGNCTYEYLETLPDGHCYCNNGKCLVIEKSISVMVHATRPMFVTLPYASGGKSNLQMPTCGILPLIV